MSTRVVIRWNQEETDYVVQHAAKIRVETGLPVLEAVNKVSKSLPDARRRHFQYPSNIPVGIRDAINTTVEELLKAKKHTPEPVVEQPVQVVQPAPAKIELPVLVTQEMVTHINAAMTELIRAVGDSFEQSIMHECLGRIDHVFGRVTKIFEEQKARVKLPRILVVGPIAAQQEILKKEFEQMLDLRFVASSESPAQIKAQLGSVSHVVLWTEFASHSHQNMIPKDKLVLVSGGMSSLKDKLTEIAVG